MGTEAMMRRKDDVYSLLIHFSVMYFKLAEKMPSQIKLI